MRLYDRVLIQIKEDKLFLDTKIIAEMREF